MFERNADARRHVHRYTLALATLLASVMTTAEAIPPPGEDCPYLSRSPICQVIHSGTETGIRTTERPSEMALPSEGVP